MTTDYFRLHFDAFWGLLTALELDSHGHYELYSMNGKKVA